MVGNWLNASWSHFYGNAYAQMNVVLESTKPGGILADPNKFAIANIWKVYIFMPVTDYWGAVPYSQAGNGKNEVLYDTQADIYKDFSKHLKMQQPCWRPTMELPNLSKKEILFWWGMVKKWLKAW